MHLFRLAGAQGRVVVVPLHKAAGQQRGSGPEDLDALKSHQDVPEPPRALCSRHVWRGCRADDHQVRELAAVVKRRDRRARLGGKLLLQLRGRGAWR